MPTQPTREDLRQAFLAFRQSHGLTATQQLLRNAFGADDLDAIPEEQWTDAIRKLNEGASTPTVKASGTLDAVAIFARWNQPKRTPPGEPG